MLTEAVLRKVIQEEIELRFGSLEERLGSLEGRLGSLEGRLGSLEGRLGSLEKLVAEGFEAVDQRFDAVDQRLGALGDAVVLLARHLPGSIPGEDSHVVRKVRKTLAGGVSSASGRIAAKGP